MPKWNHLPGRIAVFAALVGCCSAALVDAADEYPLTLDEITVRDPFIFADANTKTYYLYAQTGNRGVQDPAAMGWRLTLESTRGRTNPFVPCFGCPLGPTPE